MAKWLNNVRVAVDDAESVTLDMLRPPRRRDLGPRLHREQFREARKTFASLLDYADVVGGTANPARPGAVGHGPPQKK